MHLLMMNMCFKRTCEVYKLENITLKIYLYDSRAHILSQDNKNTFREYENKYKNSKIFSSAPGLTSRLMFAVNSNVLLNAKLNPAQHISVLLPLSTTKREMVS